MKFWEKNKGEYTFEQFYDTADPAWYTLLKELARKNRKNPTEAEAAMWKLLRTDFKECNFRRQHIIGDYIADFASFSCSLVIEVDGGYHNDEEQMKWDERRTDFIKSRGLNVIRFTNDEVLGNPESVKETLYNLIYI